MARIRRIDLGWATCYTNSPNGDGQFNPMQVYIRAPGIGKIRMGWEAHGESVANMISRPGFQVADVENNIVSTNTLGTDTQTSNGVKFPSAMADISATTQARQLFRGGIWVKNPAGNNNLNTVRVHLWIEYEEC